MRTLRWLGGGVIWTLALWGPVLAQQALQPTTGFTGVQPRDIKFQPINVGGTNKAFNMRNSFPNQPQQSPSSLGTMFPKLTLGTWPPKTPSVPILSQKQNPFQPKPIVGKNPFGPTKPK